MNIVDPILAQCRFQPDAPALCVPGEPHATIAYAQLGKLVNNVARQLETTPARVALAWVHSRPGVASTIIGARTIEQLEENLGALDLRLRPEHEDALEEASRPRLNFPAAFLAVVGPHPYGGTTINGETFPVSPFAPKNDAEHF